MKMLIVFHFFFFHLLKMSFPFCCFIILLLWPGISSSIFHTAEEINAIQYHYDIDKSGDQATFTFTLKNISHASGVLQIQSFYFSITYIDENLKEVRLPENETILFENASGVLKMENLEEDGSYFVCVFFLTDDHAHLIASSRFCHLVTMNEGCQLEKSEKAFSNRHILILVAFSCVIFLLVVIITIIRKYIYRPRTIAAILETLPVDYAKRLTELADKVDGRRQHKPTRALGTRLREDSRITIDYDPNADHEFYKYHSQDNASLDILPE